MEPISSNMAHEILQVGAQTGNHNLIYIAVFLLVMQAILLPVTNMLLKKKGEKIAETQELNNKIIDLETEKRKAARDGQMLEIKTDFNQKLMSFDKRLEAVEVNFRHQVEKLVENSERQSKAMERLFEKFDDMSKNFTKILTSKIFNK